MPTPSKSAAQKLDPAQRSLADAAYAPGVRIEVLAASAGRLAISVYKALHRISLALVDCTQRVLTREEMACDVEQERLELKGLTAIVSTGSRKIRCGEHMAPPKSDMPIANYCFTLMQQAGMPLEKLSYSEGNVPELLG